jgi:SAM-dependent methyltransferase
VTSPDERAALDARDAATDRPDFASRRLSFGAAADAYDAYRPGYSAEIVSWMLGNPAPGHPVRVLDLASGTGRLGQTAAELGHDVVAVEPDDAMRAKAVARIGAERVFAGTAEAIPLPDSSVDAVTVGTAWHWFNPDTAPAEIARVLRPGGLLSVAWNLRDDRVPWVAEFDDIVDGQDRVLRTKEVRFDLPVPYFRDTEHAEIAQTVVLPRDGLVGLARSMSYVRLRPDAAELFAQVEQLVGTHPDLVGQETFDVPWVASCFRAKRVDL